MARTPLWFAAAAMALLMLALPGCGFSRTAEAEHRPIPPKLAKELDARLESYQQYLTYNAINLAESTRKLLAAVKAGDRARARNLYVEARGWLGRVAPAVDAQPALAKRLEDPDARTGFPWLERMLWTGKSSGLLAGISAFQAESERLRLAVEHAALRPEALAKAALRPLEAIRSRDLAGREEPYSHIDLVDAAATVEGVVGVLEAMHPAIEGNERLTRELDVSTGDIYEFLGALESNAHPSRERSYLSAPSTSFPRYGHLPQGELSEFRKHLARLTKLISRASSLPGL